LKLKNIVTSESRLGVIYPVLYARAVRC